MMIVRMDMNPSGYFAAQAPQVGTSDEEIVAISNNQVQEERIRAIAGRLSLAASTLQATVPLGTG